MIPTFIEPKSILKPATDYSVSQRSINLRKGVNVMDSISVREVFEGMPQRLNQSLAKGLDAVCQFTITGDGGGNWYLVIKEGVCQVHAGTAHSPKVTLTMGSETWLDMVSKKVNGMQAFMMGKLKVGGDMALAQRIPALFSF